MEGKDQSRVVVYQAGENSKEQNTQRTHCRDPPNPNVHQVGPRERTPQPERGAQSWGSRGAQCYSYHGQTHFGRSFSSEPENEQQ